MEAAVATSRPRSVARWTILGGLLYVVFFVVGTIMLFSGAPDGDAATAPFRVAEDASQISTAGESDNWDALEVTVLLRTQTAIIRGGRGGRTWKYDGSSWVAYLDKITALAYPG